MAKSWVIDGKSIARKVMCATSCPKNQIGDSGAKRECPKCNHWIDNSDVTHEWPGLPAGVKFDPSDLELLDHLAAKCCVENAVPHMFIDEFIPTLSEDRGICYTHPKNLPGAKKDGSCIHYFHKTAKAYASGPRKRRKIQSEQSEEKVRWHKTGKTKPIADVNGVQKGYKKIMVLYRCSVKGSKPVKSNWVMHQYHLGTEEDEREGIYVVSKLTYQLQKETEKDYDAKVHTEPLMQMFPSGPNTPAPNPVRPGIAEPCDFTPDQDLEAIDEASGHACIIQPEEDSKCKPIVAGESKAEDMNLDSIELLCKDENPAGSFGYSELANLDFDSPPDFLLADLHFGTSQDNFLDWLF